MRKALFSGIAGAFFIAFTFILNRSMDLSAVTGCGAQACAIFIHCRCFSLFYGKSISGRLFCMKSAKDLPSGFSGVPSGSGFFTPPLSLASSYGESWLIASTRQITIVAGVLLTPLFGQKIPLKNLAMSFLILAGIFIMQGSHWGTSHPGTIVKVLTPILIAAFSYPLGNRMTMAGCPSHITAIQRIFGMTLCSMPFWLICSAVAYSQAGWPNAGQNIQSFLVALFSGVIATYLFFHATDMVKNNPRQLAMIEATQSGEVIFTLLGGVLLLGDSAPSALSFLGVALIVLGMTINSLITD